MTDQQDQPGATRSPGATIADTLRSDAVPPPQPLLEARNEYMGDSDIPFARYTDQAFFDREMNSLWPRCWQWACREEHLQDVGDTYVYDVGRYSVIVVRSSPDEIKAFLNTCTHRGTRLLGYQGGGYSGGFRCPFHGWSWQLDGCIDNIPGRWDFPHVSDETHGLQPVQCELWGGFVFINMDPEAAPLHDFLDVLPDHFQHFPLDQRRIRLHVQKTLPANWKAAQEAFIEAYHNFETHNSPNGGNAQYDIFGDFVTRFIHNLGNYSPESLVDYPGEKFREPVMTEDELLRSMTFFGHGKSEVGPGETARSVAAAGLREQLGTKFGIDLSEVSDSIMLDSIEYHLFPNMFFFPGINVPMVYRFRPNGMDVDSSLFDFVILEPLSEGATHPEPPEPHILDVEQSYTEVEELGWLGPVYDEDTGNLALQTQGFKTSRKQGLTLGNYQESRIRRVHLTLDKFMDEREQGASNE